jgi:hypothetical protein
VSGVPAVCNLTLAWGLLKSTFLGSCSGEGGVAGLSESESEE